MEPLVLCFIIFSVLVFLAIIVALIVLFKDSADASNISENDVDQEQDIPTQKKEKSGFLSSFLKRGKDKEIFDIPEATKQPEDFTALQSKFSKSSEAIVTSNSTVEEKSDVKKNVFMNQSDSEMLTFSEALAKDSENTQLSKKSDGNMNVLSLGESTIKTQKRVDFATKEALSKQEEAAIEKDIDLSEKYDVLEKKYKILDTLFKEKSTNLEKFEEQVSSEKKHRQDFNKVKDILEKELKDLKDDNKFLKNQLKDAFKENEVCIKSGAETKNQVSVFEKNISEKKEEIKILTNNLDNMKEVNHSLEKVNQEIKQSAENVEKKLKDLKQQDVSVEGSQHIGITLTPDAINKDLLENKDEPSSKSPTTPVTPKMETINDPISGAAPYISKNKKGEED